MKVSIASIIVPIAGCLAAAYFVPLEAWEGLRTALLPALSVIGAAVLVRLARGLPFTNADHFTLPSFRAVAANLEANARKLRALIFICLAAITALITFPGVIGRIATVSPGHPWVAAGAAGIASGILGLLVIYAFVRTIEVVHSDVALLKLQSDTMERVIASKNAEKFTKETAAAATGIAGGDTFGGKLV